MPAQPTAIPSSLPRAESWLARSLTALIILLALECFAFRGGFWRDEVDLINLSAQQNPLKEIRHDSFPVLMSVLVRTWMQVIGHTDLALRSLGLIICLGLLTALWCAGKSLRRSPPLIALVLFGLNSTVIAFDQAIRAYGLGSALILGYLAAMWAFLQKPTPGRLLLLLILAVLSVQTVFQNAVLIAAISTGAFAVCLRRNLRLPALKILAVGILAAISLKPYLGGILASHEVVNTTAAAVAPRTWHDFLPLAELMSYPFLEYRYVWLTLLVIVILAGLCRLRVNLKTTAPVDRSDAQVFGGVTALAALAGFVWFFTLVETQTQPWHFLPLLAVLAPFLDLVLDLNLNRTLNLNPHTIRLLRTAVFGLILASALAAAAFAQRDLRNRFTSADVIAAKLKAEATARDYIIVTPWYCGISYNRYHSSAAPWDTLPPITNHSLHHYELVTEFMRTSNAMQSVREKITATLSNGGCVWVAGWMDLQKPGVPAPKDMPPPPLKHTGMSDTPYNLTWNWQIGHFLSDHATNVARVPLTSSNYFNYNESLELTLAQGWRTNAP